MCDSAVAPRLWNYLPLSLHTPLTLKKQPKTFLYTQAFNLLVFVFCSNMLNFYFLCFVVKHFVIFKYEKCYIDTF